MTKVDYKELKKGGFMKQIQKDQFALRIKIVGGNLEAEKLKTIYHIADKYGEKTVHMTSRQSIEIPFIKLNDIKAVKQELAKAGLEPGACGPRVRTITACQGNRVCSSGLIDTTELAIEFDERYFAMELPHKFKLGITGCRNNCLKAEENDLGVKGGIEPSWNESLCTYCGLCEAVCPVKAIKVDKKNRNLSFNLDDCIYCGKCVKSCPFDAWEGKAGFIISFGGLFGNRISVGRQIVPILFNKEDVHKVVEITLDFFNRYGKPNERFGNTLDRVGWNLLEKELKEVV